jgi:2-polyprenyl-6-methoxyphenol hydroxylase-like FAD-dependent oxidoreductase
VTEETRDVSCCVVGGGPGGATLAYLLARKGISVLLLEAHRDFAREFRGDTIHPSILEILEDLGLAERLLALPHAKIRRIAAQTPGGARRVMVDFGRLPTRYPYIAMLPQERFLEFLTGEAKRFPSFRLEMGARVEGLLERDGRVTGVRVREGEGMREVRALLTVGADGRFSAVRRLAGLETVRTSPPMDVLWFRIPRRPEDADPEEGRLWTGRGRLLVTLDRGSHWQIGFVIPKGGYEALRAAGLEGLRRAIVEVAPEFGDRVGEIRDWKEVSLLSVESSRVRRWWKRGLLLIGDAAHAMSPVAGVGINMAIQDAVVAAEELAAPLAAGTLEDRSLASVQRRRERPTRLVQAVQAFVQRRLVARALDARTRGTLPLFVRLPFVRRFISRFVAFGIGRVRVRA